MNKKLILCLFCCAFVVACGCSIFKEKRKDHTAYKAIQKPRLLREITPPNGRLTVGEILFYKVRWLGLDVGDATLAIQDAGQMEGRNVRKVILRAWTNKFFSFFYKVDGTIESYVDAETFKPLKYNSETHINKKFVFKKMRYDFEKKVVFAEDKKGTYEVAITDDILDPLGVFYYFRQNDVVFGKQINITINGGKKNFPIAISAQRQRLINTPAGKFWAFQIEPTPESERQFDDSLNAEGSMRMWFSGDGHRYPLIVALKVPLGTAKAILTKIVINRPELTGHN